MRQSRFSDEQIVNILREVDGSTISATAKRHGISDQTLYAWKKRFGVVTPNKTKEKRALGLENTRLKRMLIQRDLEIEVMKEIALKSGEHAGSTPTSPISHFARLIDTSGV